MKKDTQDLVKRLRRKDIKNLFESNYINSVSLIWSYSRWEQGDKSDVDLVFKLNNNSKLTLLKLISIKNELEKKLNVSIDLVEENSINKYYKNSITKDKRIIF